MRIRMPVIATSLFLGAAVASSAHAVTTIGARAGVSIASVSLDAQQTFDAANRTGFTGTLFLDSGLGFINLQPEVSYIQKGAKSVTTDATIALDYIEVAALLKIGLPIPAIQPHVFVGIGADISTDTSIDVNNSTLTINNLDWTVPLGVDIRLAFGRLGVYADARYAVGLANINEGTAIFANLKNRAWILSAGVGCEF
jgi:Outer membrane protein beta-barrel domain